MHNNINNILYLKLIFSENQNRKNNFTAVWIEEKKLEISQKTFLFYLFFYCIYRRKKIPVIVFLRTPLYCGIKYCRDDTLSLKFKEKLFGLKKHQRNMKN